MEKLSNIFDITYGNGFELNRLSINKTGINFISRTAKNNGVSAKVEKLIDVEPFKAGLITVSLGGSVLETFLQTSDFYTSYHIFCLRPKIELSEKQKLFYCLCIRANKYRYSYGRQANKTLGDILIPSVSEIPVWVEKIQIPSIPSKKSAQNKTLNLNTSNWKYFNYNELFDIKKGKRLTKEDFIPGNTPFIGAIDSNNGYRDFIGQEPIHQGNTITVNYNGSVGESFYQPNPFWASDDVNVLYSKFKLNKYIAFFLITLIRLEKFRFNYGRKWETGKMNKSRIKLPVDIAGKPDFDFMENYIKSLPFSISI
jgi:hypothetical protein